MLTCNSTIEAVVVYATGAEINRWVELPRELPEERCQIRIPGVTPLAQPGSLRALAQGAREVLAVTSRLVFPETGRVLGEVVEKLRTLELERLQMSRLQSEIAERRSVLLTTELDIGMRGRRKHLDPLDRLGQAQAVAELNDDVVGSMDAEIHALQNRLEELSREIQALALEREQASAADALAEGQPQREIFVELAAGSSSALETLRIQYAVETARWWPTYSVRLTEAAQAADFALEAFVVQTSLEDWTSVKLGLSTADRVLELALPELPSMRLGRYQPPRDRGFRAPPEGLEGLFASYDQASERLKLSAHKRSLSLPDDAPVRMTADRMEKEVALAQAHALIEEQQNSLKTLTSAVLGPPGGAGGGAPPPAPAMAQPRYQAQEPDMMISAKSASASRGRRSVSKSKKRSAVSRERAEPSLSKKDSSADYAKGAMADDWGSADEEYMDSNVDQFDGDGEDGTLTVDESWLDYDALELRDPMTTEKSRRGRLVRAPSRPGHAVMREAVTRFHNTEAPNNTTAPAPVHGTFDYRYDAEGAVKIPADGMLHRLQLRSQKAQSTPRLRTVPLEDPTVFREVELVNPFEAPLLAGPLDVFVGGALVTTTVLSVVDTGGQISFGLGAEDRLTVVRNPRMEEVTSHHILGNRTHANHHISIEVASALGFACIVEVVDRIPITYDDNIEVVEVKHTPKAEHYEQRDRYAPISGGLLWKLALEPGGSQKIDLEYSIELPAKYEVQGGNHRD